ncbi:hypothetical protein AYM02_02240 [Coxiella burnetii]|uniref:Uncharacterized protein n=1 Tax=Coxiella burnetii (strain RSA 493 / Nine Mile phase I) TaxID=227377 RepID=Q83AG9_COXBU|nr:hypothetical protein [Coxiella burnetii]NP_820907.1 hypothetical protein CBU_1930 [Coxiella burnetii RSA 493]ACJ17498.1 hypothetical protein CbuG_0039 [Coxiella burnetii CbuG_Q212]ACJ19364.1 hypothetical protein CbuK_0037 [Coxiella burnetii CbuK_Q154]ATN85037.1 hypothetical protein AYO29_00155 [Coxiella burnetii str. Schperling]EDQ95100.1 hypothetical protein A35_00190 [Coxiella burnetii 'MSU Goat Q177']EDR36167.1 hypothetical protein COXBURSA334_0146 [Coxiella burnetii Q321]
MGFDIFYYCCDRRFIWIYGDSSSFRWNRKNLIFYFPSIICNILNRYARSRKKTKTLTPVF